MSGRTKPEPAKLARELYTHFYAASKKPAVSPVSLKSVHLKDIVWKSPDTKTTMENLASKKWSVLDADRRVFKVHDAPHNYNVQIRGHKGPDAKKDSVMASKNMSKLAKYMLSGTGVIELPFLNIETEKMSSAISRKLQNLGVSVPTGSRYSFEFTERFFRTQTLDQFLKSGVSPRERKALMKQLISALATCRETLPGFVHSNINGKTVNVLSTNPFRTDIKDAFEVRLSGFESCSIEPKSSITGDLRAVASLFEKSGGNPEGTSDFLKRMVNAKTYKKVLGDKYFSDGATSFRQKSTSYYDDSDYEESKEASSDDAIVYSPSTTTDVMSHHNPVYKVLNAKGFFSQQQPQGMQQPQVMQQPSIPDIVPPSMSTAAMFQQQTMPDFQQMQAFPSQQMQAFPAQQMPDFSTAQPFPAQQMPDFHQSIPDLSIPSQQVSDISPTMQQYINNIPNIAQFQQSGGGKRHSNNKDDFFF